jgi:hypothetical protein
MAVYIRIIGRIDVSFGIILAAYCYSSMKQRLHFYEFKAHAIER